MHKKDFLRAIALSIIIPCKTLDAINIEASSTTHSPPYSTQNTYQPHKYLNTNFIRIYNGIRQIQKNDEQGRRILS
jgi:hypothetical protein